MKFDCRRFVNLLWRDRTLQTTRLTIFSRNNYRYTEGNYTSFAHWNLHDRSALLGIKAVLIAQCPRVEAWIAAGLFPIRICLVRQATRFRMRNFRRYSSRCTLAFIAQLQDSNCSQSAFFYVFSLYKY